MQKTSDEGHFFGGYFPLALFFLKMENHETALNLRSLPGNPWNHE